MNQVQGLSPAAIAAEKELEVSTVRKILRRTPKLTREHLASILV